METASPFFNAVIGTEIMSVLICLILFAGNKLENKGKSKQSRWFGLLVLSTMTGAGCDAVSWILDGRPQMSVILFITTIGSMVMTMVILGIFISYLSVYMRERKAVSNIPEIVAWTAVSIGLAATIIAGITGNLFTFPNGVFTEKPLYSLYVVVNTLFMVIGLVFVAVYGKVLEWYEKIAAYAYMLIPIITAITGLFVDGWEFSYPAITISVLLVYLVLQSDRVKQLEKEGTITNYRAMHDDLTGLYNRNAYRDRVQSMKTKAENSGVIFGDLNGLKYTNDTLGHEAGDRLLIRYALMLTEIFRMNDIYRISGDEFICIMENTPEAIFIKRAEELEGILNRETPPLACIGTSYGKSADIETLVRNAENKMYEEKKIVHDRYPKMMR